MEIKEMLEIVKNSILKISKEFKENRALYLSESDIKCRLFKLIDRGEKANGSYLVHSEIALFGENGKNKIDIYITELPFLEIGENKWSFEDKYDKMEDIGIELKFNYGQYTKNALIDKLKKDVKRLKDYEVKYKFVLCFDHNGELTKKDILKQNFAEENVHFFYVDGKNKIMFPEEKVNYSKNSFFD